jgi:hypothetical protein
MLEAGVEFYTALLGFQTELGAVRKNKKVGGNYSWTYGDMDAIMIHVKDLLEKYKLAISPTRFIADGCVYLRTKIIHSPTAQGIEDVAPLPSYTETEWSDQEMGKNTTYHRRYALQVLLNLTFENDRSDNDEGSKGKRRQPGSNTSNDYASVNTMTLDQIKNLEQAISGLGNEQWIRTRILEFNEVGSFAELPQSKYMAVFKFIADNGKPQVSDSKE